MRFTRKFRFVHESPRKGKTMKRLIGTTSVASVAIGTVFAFAPAAHADTPPCTTDSNGTQYCNTQVASVAYGDVNTQTLAVASSDVKGKVNLQFQSSSGFKTSAKCVTVSSWAQRAGHRCFIVGTKMKGKHFANSGVNRNGTRVYFNDYVGSKYTPVGSKFYWDAKHRTWRKANCGNFVRFSRLPTLKVVNVALVKTFSAVKVTVYVTQTATEAVTSTASCTGNGTSASATAKGTGSATGTATATASAKTQSQATTTATSQVKSAVQSSASALAFAAAEVNMTSQTWVSCSSTNQPPAQTILITSLTQLNQIPAGRSSGNFIVTVHASDAGGELTVDPGIGAVSDCSGGALQSNMTFTGLAAGDNTLCLQLWAPNDASQPTSMTATFTATLGSASDVKSQTFTITYPTRT
jgi:hypothetical protein